MFLLPNVTQHTGNICPTVVIHIHLTGHINWEKHLFKQEFKGKGVTWA